MTYTVFRRTCNNWKDFSRARKFTIRTGLSLEEARRMCQQFNDNRNDSQIKRGTKYEFIREGE